MKYRAILVTTTPEERPVQIFGESREMVVNWAKLTLAKRPIGDYVEIYETAERRIAIHGISFIGPCEEKKP